MTHGEQRGSETHQDSAVLTYLEGLLMHQAAGGQRASETQSGSQEQRNEEERGHVQSNHGSRQERNRTNSLCGASQHLRKARLLNSEAWTDRESQRRSEPPAALNTQSEDHHKDQNGCPQDTGESTMLQSFSSRLQNMNLPHQIIPGLRPQDTPCKLNKTSREERPALSHLKELVSKTKRNHSISVPYQHRRYRQERFSESPTAPLSNTPSPSPESCTQRLKAVVHTRSTLLPKPSEACSQLALLLSSEAHLQQYSREHALKAHLSARLANERLSVMATHQIQDKKQATISGQTRGLNLLHTQRGTPSQLSTSSSRQSPGQRQAEGSMHTGHCFRKHQPFEKQGRPSQNCSSLLLHLLNTPQQINRQGDLKNDITAIRTLSSPLLSDSEPSNPDSTYCGFSPIDLSVKTRTPVQTPVSASQSPALERVSEILNRWKPDNLPAAVTGDTREMDVRSEMKPHHNVTLLQLLLDHKKNKRVNKNQDNPDFPQDVIPRVSRASTSVQSVFSPARCKDTHDFTSHCGFYCRSPKLLPVFSQSRASNSNKEADLSRGCMKEESVETYGPTVQKKQKFLKLDNHNSSGQQGGNSERSGCKDDYSGVRGFSGPSSPPEADSPPARFPPFECHENQGFNVLKQLLLSHTASHTLLNGNTIKQICTEPPNLYQRLSREISKRADSH